LHERAVVANFKELILWDYSLTKGETLTNIIILPSFLKNG
jgi:hypothetical protein